MTTQKFAFKLRPTRFDTIVWLTMAGLVAAILITTLLGDQVGVQIVHVGPSGQAASTTRISVTFNEPMNWQTVIERMQYSPTLAGEYTWSGKTIRFTPHEPLQRNVEYHVTLAAGAESTGQRKVLHDTSFTFQVRPLRVAYLTPADAVPQNVWIAQPGQSDSAEQITFSPTGILNFDVSPDGTMIALSEHNESGTSDIKVLDLKTGGISQVTECTDSACDTPVWRPDGSMIAYERVDLNSDFTAVGVSPTRVWLADLTTTPPTNQPLFEDNQKLGFNPQWSADGSRIAVYDTQARSVYVRDFAQDRVYSISLGSGGGDVALSPDGEHIVFSHLVADDVNGGLRSVLQIADVESGTVRDLVDPQAPVDDTQTAWNPDGRSLAVARHYTDARATRTRQLFRLDVTSGAAQEMIFDERYSDGFFAWDPQGDQLALYRFPELTSTGEQNTQGRPEIWVYDAVQDTLTQVAQNAYSPQWVP